MTFANGNKSLAGRILKLRQTARVEKIRKLSEDGEGLPPRPALRTASSSKRNARDASVKEHPGRLVFEAREEPDG